MANEWCGKIWTPVYLQKDENSSLTDRLMSRANISCSSSSPKEIVMPQTFETLLGPVQPQCVEGPLEGSSKWCHVLFNEMIYRKPAPDTEFVFSTYTITYNSHFFFFCERSSLENGALSSFSFWFLWVSLEIILSGSLWELERANVLESDLALSSGIAFRQLCDFREIT